MGMIRKMKEQDRKLVMDFLAEEPSINLFLIGDIEAFGFDKDFQVIWGQFDDENHLEGVLLRYHENHIAYWKKNDFDSSGFKEIIMQSEGKVMISGKESIANEFTGVFDNSQCRTMHFCELKNSENLMKENNFVKKATQEDAERIYNLIEGIEEFSELGNDVDRIRKRLNNKTGRMFYKENDKGDMVSIAQTTAENSMSAMVVGVATDINYRGKGYMSNCLSVLCREVLGEGKTLCLFYDNPKAGSVYHRLGFESIDNWLMITK